MDTNSLVLSQEEAEQMQKEDMEFVTALYGSDYVNKMLATTQSEAKEIDNTINKRIVQIRKSKKISQIELAKNAGISVNMPAKFSKNKPMNTDIINKVCEYLHVQPSDIMEWIPDAEYNKTNEEKQAIEAQIAELQEKLKNL